MQLDASRLTVRKLYGIYCYSCNSEERDGRHRETLLHNIHNVQAHCEVLSLLRKGTKNLKTRVFQSEIILQGIIYNPQICMGSMKQEGFELNGTHAATDLL
jgi:hypothetical protein